MAGEQHRPSREGGFTLIELLIAIVISGIIASALGNALVVVLRNYSVTFERFSGANDSLTVTNLFPSDIAATPPLGRENEASLPSGCPGVDPAGSSTVLRLTWSELDGSTTSFYRVNYRIVPDPSGAEPGETDLLRISCTSRSGPDVGYEPRAARLVASGLAPFTGPWLSGAPAALSYAGSLDADKLSLTLSLNTSPPTTATISGTRMNWARSLPPSPLDPSLARLSVLTTTSSPPYTVIGAMLEFSSTVTNIGTTSVVGVQATDDAAGGTLSCPSTTLAPGAGMTCTFSHVVTQADLDIGGVTSTTTVNATPPDSVAIIAVASAVTVPAVQTLQMTAVKSTTTADYKVAGDVILYTLVVENTGNVSLSGLFVTDPAASAPVGCPTSALGAAGTASDSVTCTYEHTVTDDDLVVGGAVDTAAHVDANGPLGTPATATSNSVSVSFLASPALTAVKLAGQTTFALAGEVLHYTITVTNTGNVSLSAISIADANDSDATIICDATVLAVNASTTCGADHIVTDGDITAGTVINEATATATPASGGGPISVVTNEEAVTYTAGASVRITTTVAEQTFKNVGDVLHYTYTVANTGAIPLSDATVTDPGPGGSSSLCGSGPVLVGQQITCALNYSVATADLGSSIIDTAFLTANSANGPLGATANSVSVGFLADPKLTVTLVATPSPFSMLGQVLTYGATITNTGNVPLSSVGISTFMLGTAPACTPTTLAVGATATCSSTYSTTNADASGSVTNTVTAVGTHAESVHQATSASLTVSSIVPCSVASITATVPGSAAVPPTVERTGSNNGNGWLKATVTVVVQTSGKCAGLRIKYYPQGPATGVIDTMVESTGGTWTFLIVDDHGHNASEWRSGPAQVDVLPASGGTAINTSVYVPFTVVR